MAVARIVVNIANAPSYDVRIGGNLVEKLGGYLREVNQSDTARTAFSAATPIDRRISSVRAGLGASSSSFW